MVRAAEYGQLRDAVAAAVTGAGTTVFVEGDLGSGKRTLLRSLAARATEGADPGIAGAYFATCQCARTRQMDDAYEPFAELLLHLIADAEDRTGRAWDAVLQAVQDVAPDWLGMVPIAGPAIQAGVKTALRAREVYAAETEAVRAQLESSRHAQFLVALDRRLSKVPAVALVIGQAEWIDPGSAALLEKIARMIAGKRVALFVTYRPADVDQEHPLAIVRRSLRVDGLAETTVSVGALSAEEAATLVRSATGKGLEADVAEWLVQFTEGNPLFITQLLPVLCQRGVLVERDQEYVFGDDAHLRDGELTLVGGLTDVHLPGRIVDVLDERLERIEKSLRDLLAIASVEGTRFLSGTLALVAARTDADVLLTELDDAEKRHGLVRYVEPLSRDLYRYEFTHLLLRQRIYESVPQPVRRSYHPRIADALVELYGDHPPRPILLDIAGHYEAGSDREAAARFLLLAAESAQLDGALPQAVTVSRHALQLLDEAEQGPRPADTQALRAQLVAILIAGQWEDTHGQNPELDELIRRGVRAAERSGDPGLHARLLHAEARYLLGTQSAARALELLTQARGLAHQAGDGVSELAITVDLGNTTAVESVDQGLATLREALALYETVNEQVEDEHGDLAALHGLLLAFIAIGEFDRGNLGQARSQIDASLAGLREAGREEAFARILNYRAQIDLAIGDLAEAERDARDAIAHASDPVGPWATYNRAVLGRVLLAAGRPDEAETELRTAWAQAQEAWQLRLGLVVRQHVLGYLLRPGSSDAELAEAEALLGDQVTQSEQGAFTNMVVTARSLQAEAALRHGQVEQACVHSRAAVELLESREHLALVQPDRILSRHATCLAAAGDEAGAQRYRSLAGEAFEHKLASLTDDRLHGLLEATPLAMTLRT